VTLLGAERQIPEGTSLLQLVMEAGQQFRLEQFHRLESLPGDSLEALPAVFHHHEVGEDQFILQRPPPGDHLLKIGGSKSIHHMQEAVGASQGLADRLPGLLAVGMYVNEGSPGGRNLGGMKDVHEAVEARIGNRCLAADTSFAMDVPAADTRHDLEK